MFDAGIYLFLDGDTPRLVLEVELTAAKAEQEQPTAADERWITLKPHGGNSEHYVHVKVKVHKDGTAHVIHGAKGLRGLKLRKLSSPEELKLRAAKRKEEEKTKLESMTPEQRQAHQQTKLERKAHMEGFANERMTAHRAAIEAANKVMGSEVLKGALSDDDFDRVREALQSATDADVNPTDSAKAAQKAHERTVGAALRKLEQHLVKTLSVDTDLADEVLTDPNDLVKPTKPQGGKGYAYDPALEAGKHHFSETDAAKEAEAVREKHLQQLEQTDPEAAARKRARLERVKQKRAEREAVRGAIGTPDVKPEPDLSQKAEAVRALLESMKKLRSVEKQMRSTLLERDPNASAEEKQALAQSFTDPEGNAVDTLPDDFSAELEKRIQEESATGLTRAFLDEVHTPSEGFDAENIRSVMRAPHAKGSYQHFSNVLLTVLGTDRFDRVAHDALGVEASAALVAHALRRDLSPEDLERVKTALGNHHETSSTAAMQEATERAQALREQAQAITLPEVTDAQSAVAAKSILEKKTAILKEAHQALGQALGQLESGAALNLALKSKPREQLIIPLGSTPLETSILTLRALGLDDGDYEIAPNAHGENHAVLKKSAMDKLTAGQTPEDRELENRAEAIKNGAEDEADWLPQGFTRYSSGALSSTAPTPTSIAKPPNLTDMQSGLESFIGERLADGWTPADIALTLRGQDFKADWVAPDREKEYLDTLESLMPAIAGQETRTARDGTQYTINKAVDYDNLEAHPEIKARLEGLGQRFNPESGQTLTPDLPTKQALFLALTQQVRDGDKFDPKASGNPALISAFKPLGDLTPEDTRAIRRYYHATILGRPPETVADQHHRAKSALQEFDEKNPEPDKWQDSDQGLFSMFGDADTPRPVTISFDGATPDEQKKHLERLGLKEKHYTPNADGSLTLNDAGKAAVQTPHAEMPVRGLERLSHEWVAHQHARTQAAHNALHDDHDVPWADFVENVGGVQRAYQAIQDQMRGELVQKFAQHYGKLTGTPLTLTKSRTAHGEAVMRVRDPQAWDEFKATRQAAQDQTRARQGGKFSSMGGAGSVLEAYRQKRQQDRANQMAGGMLFDTRDDNTQAPERLEHLERPALAPHLENALAQMVNSVKGGITPESNPVNIIPDLTMGAGTKFVKQQRAIKLNMAARKAALWLGVGSGKSKTMLGTFAQLHHQGEVKKGIFAVPSIVRNQFGDEAAQAFEPGRFNWHAQDATFEERLKAYQDPEMHMVSVTQPAFRDDMMRVMATHHGVSPELMRETFLNGSRETRNELLKTALESHGIPLDYLAADEAHDTLNRAGKEESTLSAVMDTALELSKYGTLATGSPIKNDLSELHSWLQKLDPDRFPDRAQFMRQYDPNTSTGKQALKRLIARYTMSDVVPNGTVKSVTWGQHSTSGDSPSGHARIPLTDQQKAELEGIETHYRTARKAAKRGVAHLESIRALTPARFANAPEADHPRIAQGLMQNLGMLRHTAVGRVIDQAPAEHNAKIKHLVGLAHERRGRGGVVFAHHRATIEHTRAALENAGHRVTVLTGSDSSDQKREKIRSWESGGGIILCSDAGATGANLQKTGQWLVNMDLPMTQKTLEQRNARIDRLGQDKPIELHHLLSDSEYDNENFDRLEKKRLLGSVFQGQHERLDDTGLAKELALAGLERTAPVQTQTEDDDQDSFFKALDPSHGGRLIRRPQVRKDGVTVQRWVKRFERFQQKRTTEEDGTLAIHLHHPNLDSWEDSTQIERDNRRIDPYRHARSYFDPRYAHVVENRYGEKVVAPKDPSYRDYPEVEKRAGHIYRGIDQEGANAIAETGLIQTRGDYNVGINQRKTDTYYADNPRTAFTYARGTAAEHIPMPGEHAYMMEVEKPDDAGKDYEGSDETFTPNPVPSHKITRAWEVIPYHVTIGAGRFKDDKMQDSHEPMSNNLYREMTPDEIDTRFGRKLAKAHATGYPLAGRLKWNGLDISIENKKGDTRSGVDTDGKPWEIKMHYDYGYIRRTEGVDGDHIDCYLGDDLEQPIVYIVHQTDPVTGEYDEDKLFIGFSSPEEVKKAFLLQYDRDGFYGTMTMLTRSELKTLITDGTLMQRRILIGVTVPEFTDSKKLAQYREQAEKSISYGGSKSLKYLWREIPLPIAKADSLRHPEWHTVTRHSKTYLQRYYHAMHNQQPIIHHTGQVTLPVELPAGYITLESHPTLKEFDAYISEPYKSRGIFNPQLVFGLSNQEQARLKTALHRLDNEEFLPIYQDEKMFRWSRDVIRYLSTDRYAHPERSKLVSQFMRISALKDANEVKDTDFDLFMWVAQRPARWERLQAKLGQPALAPAGFRVYRGVMDADAKAYIPYVLSAWETNSLIQVQQHNVASWSTAPEAAMQFATDFGRCDSGVVFGGDIPFNQTQADKFTDGGNFLAYWQQYEIVVGLRTLKDKVTAHPDLTSVLYKGEWFTRLDYELLKEKLTQSS